MNEAASPPRGAYAWVAKHPRAIDRLIAWSIVLGLGGPYLVGATVGLITGSFDRWPGVIDPFIAFGLAIPLFWRRTHTVAAAGVMVVVCLVQLFTTPNLVATQIAVLVIIQALAAFAPRWASRWGLWIGIGGIVAYAIRVFAGEPTAGTVIGGLVLTGFGCSLVVVAWLLGDLTRSRRLEREALSDRAERLERERDRELLLAAADERARIAREMHDIVAHSLSIIVTQADGARYAAPPAAGPVLPALEAIAETARGSLTEMRRLLGVLRDDEAAPTGPAARIADIEPLIETVRASGLPVGWRPGSIKDRRPLPDGAELVLFRVVQESLTNVLKHAGPGARASVEMVWGTDTVSVSVSDDGRGLVDATDPVAADGSGHGLVGMRERLALYDGRLDVSSPEDGGVTIVAILPYPHDPADRAVESPAATPSATPPATPADPQPLDSTGTPS